MKEFIKQKNCAQLNRKEKYINKHHFSNNMNSPHYLNSKPIS